MLLAFGANRVIQGPQVGGACPRPDEWLARALATCPEGRILIGQQVTDWSRYLHIRLRYNSS